MTIDDIAKLIEEKSRGKRFVVFVCGFGGAGKTTFCHQLSSRLSCQSLVFETDWYAKYATMERRERIQSALSSADPIRIEREENPLNWYDWPKLVAGLHSLKKRGRLDIEGGWSQRSGEKELSLHLNLQEEQTSVILCDGI